MVNCSTDSGGSSDDGGNTPVVETSYKMIYEGTEIETFQSLNDFYTKYGTKLTEKEDYTVSKTSKTIILTKNGYDKIKGTGGDNPEPESSFKLIYENTEIETFQSLNDFYTKYGTKLTEKEDYTVSETSKTIILTKNGYDKIKETGGDNPDPNPEFSYDVKNLSVISKGIDSITLQWTKPENVSYPGYYFTVNGVKLSEYADYIDADTNGICKKTISDTSWRSENGKEITVKVTVSYMDSETYETKESEGVSVTATTEPFDGTLPCFGDDVREDIRAGNNQTVSKGDDFNLKLELSKSSFYISDYPSTFEFKSSNDSIASVDENGIVKGNATGEAKIMFKDSAGCWRYIIFTVTPTRANKIEFKSIITSPNSVWTSDNLVFTAKNPDIEVEDKNIVWTVSDASIAEISDGSITFKKEGSVSVTAGYADETVSVTAEITVLPEGAILKEDMDYDEESGWYTNPSKTLRYNGQMEIETDWNKDGVWENITGEYGYRYTVNDKTVTFADFKAVVGVNDSSEDISLMSVPVIENDNKISVKFVITNLKTTKWNTNFKVNVNTLGTLENNVCTLKIENDSKYSLEYSGENFDFESKGYTNYMYYNLKHNLSDLPSKGTVNCKAIFEVKNVSGSFDVTIY